MQNVLRCRNSQFNESDWRDNKPGPWTSRRGPEERTGGGRGKTRPTMKYLSDSQLHTRTNAQRAGPRAGGRTGATTPVCRYRGAAEGQRRRPAEPRGASAFHCVSYMLSNDRERNYSFGGGGGGGMACCLHTYYAYVARTDYILVLTRMQGPHEIGECGAAGSITQSSSALG